MYVPLKKLIYSDETNNLTIKYCLKQIRVYRHFLKLLCYAAWNRSINNVFRLCSDFQLICLCGRHVHICSINNKTNTITQVVDKSPSLSGVCVHF